MKQLDDFIHEFKGRWNGVESRCRIRVFEGYDHQFNKVVVVCEQLPELPGVSVTNAAEQIATEVCHKLELNPTRVTWVEYYPAEVHALKHGETFDEVVFNLEVFYNVQKQHCDYALVRPKWRHMFNKCYNGRVVLERWIGGTL